MKPQSVTSKLTENLEKTLIQLRNEIQATKLFFMKNSVILIIVIFFYSCSAKKKDIKINFTSNPTETYLPETEINIINDFLDTELKLDRYKNYIEYDYFVIKEALKKTKALYAYQFTYNEYYNYQFEKQHWILDSIQIKKLRSDLESEKQYLWKKPDFKSIKVNILEYEELRTIINTGAYLNLPKRLIIFLSRPLIVDDDYALLSFDIGNGDLGNNNITHFTVLMKKERLKWIAKYYFEDGVYY
jgi:hypothetical protein